MTDRLPPHDYDAEAAVLGGILIDNEAIHDAADLDPADFHRTQHRQIFTMLRKMERDGQPFDMVTLGSRLDNKQMSVIAGLMTVVPSSTRTRHYAEIVRKLAARRRVIAAAGQIATLAWDDAADYDHIMGQAQASIMDAVAGGMREGATHISAGLRALLDVTAERYAQGGVTPGLMTGLVDLDAILEGVTPGNLYVIAARPGVGKTALKAVIELAIARQGKRVLSFNMEMPEEQCWQRLVAIDTGLPFQAIRKGAMSPSQWQTFGASIQGMESLPLWINDNPGLNSAQLYGESRKHQAINGLDLITVDYLQLMASNVRYGNRVQEVGDISRGLKQLALNLNVPVIALSQLSRACEQRQDKRPVLSDLRDSGDIEQDADIVMFIYRDDYYYGAESETPNEAEIIVSKHRNGALGTARLQWDEKRIRFRNLARKEIVL